MKATAKTTVTTMIGSAPIADTVKEESEKRSDTATARFDQAVIFRARARVRRDRLRRPFTKKDRSAPAIARKSPTTENMVIVAVGLSGNVMVNVDGATDTSGMPMLDASPSPL